MGNIWLPLAALLSSLPPWTPHRFRRSTPGDSSHARHAAQETFQVGGLQWHHPDFWCLESHHTTHKNGDWGMVQNYDIAVPTLNKEQWSSWCFFLDSVALNRSLSSILHARYIDLTFSLMKFFISPLLIWPSYFGHSQWHWTKTSPDCVPPWSPPKSQTAPGPTGHGRRFLWSPGPRSLRAPNGSGSRLLFNHPHLDCFLK